MDVCLCLHCRKRSSFGSVTMEIFFSSAFLKIAKFCIGLNLNKLFGETNLQSQFNLLNLIYFMKPE